MDGLLLHHCRGCLLPDHVHHRLRLLEQKYLSLTQTTTSRSTTPLRPRENSATTTFPATPTSFSSTLTTLPGNGTASASVPEQANKSSAPAPQPAQEPSAPTALQESSTGLEVFASPPVLLSRPLSGATLPSVASWTAFTCGRSPTLLWPSASVSV